MFRPARGDLVGAEFQDHLRRLADRDDRTGERRERDDPGREDLAPFQTLPGHPDPPPVLLRPGTRPYPAARGDSQPDPGRDREHPGFHVDTLLTAKGRRMAVTAVGFGGLGESDAIVISASSLRPIGSPS